MGFCLEENYNHDIKFLNEYLKMIEKNNKDDPNIGNLLKWLTNIISRLSSNEYFWFSFECNQIIHQMFLNALKKLIDFGDEKIKISGVCYLINSIKRTSHVNHIEENENLTCWCHSLFFDFIDTSSTSINDIFANADVIKEDTTLLAILEFMILSIHVLNPNSNWSRKVEQRLYRFIKVLNSAQHLDFDSLITKILKTTFRKIRKEKFQLEFNAAISILEHLKVIIFYAFENRIRRQFAKNSSNDDLEDDQEFFFNSKKHVIHASNSNADLFDIMSHFFSISPIIIMSYLNLSYYSHFNLEVVDFFIHILRKLIAKRFNNISVEMLNSIHKCFQSIFNTYRLEIHQRLSVRQLEIANLGVEILKASDTFCDHLYWESIGDMAFRCISKSSVNFAYKLNTIWPQISLTWKQFFLASKPDGLNQAAELITTFCENITLDNIELLYFFRDAMFEFLQAHMKKAKTGPHELVQTASRSIIETSHRLKRPADEIKPLIDIFLEIFKSIGPKPWLHDLQNNPLNFYADVLDAKSRKKFYLSKDLLWKPTFDYILSLLEKYPHFEADNEPRFIQKSKFLSVVDGVVWYFDANIEIRRQVLEYVFSLKMNITNFQDKVI